MTGKEYQWHPLREVVAALIKTIEPAAATPAPAVPQGRKRPIR